jgi:hypothetical protein
MNSLWGKKIQQRNRLMNHSVAFADQSIEIKKTFIFKIQRLYKEAIHFRKFERF